MTPALTSLEFRLLNDWQRDFPLMPRPYAAMADRLGCDEDTVLERLAGLKAQGHISRVGAVFRPHVLGWSTLAAVACPPERLEEVARIIDAFPEVNHNYEREHAFNLWFVVASADGERVAQVLAEIQRATGLKPLDLPMLADYHIDLGFRLGGQLVHSHLDAASKSVDTAQLRGQLEPRDYAVAAVLEEGLEFSAHPYANLAKRCGMSETDFIARLQRLLQLSVIRRFGVVVRHRELGYTANAMVVWDIPEGRAEEAGQLLAAQPAVTLCYQRPRRPPDWPYNLFSMVHGQAREAVLTQIEHLHADLSRQLGVDRLCHAPLFSHRRFKQCGARYASLSKAA
ncbi:MAG TPA: Lrp/AsnC family transcriptional regulator [Thiobacillaceae bacterium]|nr:Lrp/AsnC family transcriptional regulator [Thiobacillaceae bacterium]HNU64111.1 Lrp/AsnC family transcriptional regulator [Thiobacillaceae bacterium]